MSWTTRCRPENNSLGSHFLGLSGEHLIRLAEGAVVGSSRSSRRKRGWRGGCRGREGGVEEVVGKRLSENLLALLAKSLPMLHRAVLLYVPLKQLRSIRKHSHFNINSIPITWRRRWSALDSLTEVERPAFTLKWVGEGSEEMVDTEDLDMMEMDYFLRLDPLKIRRLPSALTSCSKRKSPTMRAVSLIGSSWISTPRCSPAENK